MINKGFTCSEEAANVTASNATQRTADLNNVLDLANFSETGSLVGRVFKVSGNRRSSGQNRDIEELGDEGTQSSETDQVSELLQKAARAIEYLAAKCSVMEQELVAKDESIAEFELASNQWQQFAVKLQARTASDQNTIAALTARSEEAETRLAELEASAAVAVEAAAAARAKSTKLQDQVVAAFGAKSPVHSVLQAITHREAAE